MIIVLMLAGCGNDPGQPTVPGRWYTTAQVDAGQQLYTANCSVCHGADGSATADWRTPGPDGHYPPPPLNGTAHTWHHPLDQLEDSISNGGGQFGGVMPGFATTLNAAERRSVIAFIQSLWPDTVYDKWRDIEKRGR